jgi:hypothetical protein
MRHVRLITLSPGASQQQRQTVGESKSKGKKMFHMNLISKATSSLIALALACASVAAGGGIEVSTAAAGTLPGVVSIDNCRVKQGRGFAWFYCGVVSDSIPNNSVLVNYRVNLTTFKPGTGGTWYNRTGTLRFTGGQSLQTLKFAVRNKSAAQVRRQLRVTLSNPRGAIIRDATAVAG